MGYLLASRSATMAIWHGAHARPPMNRDDDWTLAGSQARGRTAVTTIAVAITTTSGRGAHVSIYSPPVPPAPCPACPHHHRTSNASSNPMTMAAGG